MIRRSALRRMAVPCLALLVAGCASRQSPPPVPRTPAPPLAPQVQPDTYLGMGAAALRQAMGPPAFIRKDGGGQMWRYDGAACRAFFFLYDAKTGAAVRHVETLPRGTTGPADPGCLAALRLSPAKTS
jgi:hypothetical protein